MGKKRMWSFEQSANPEAVELYVYGDVESDGWGWSSDTSANAFRAALAEYPNAKQIDIYINSYGGDVCEGTAIYNQLRRHSAKKVVHIDGFACSIASVIAMAGDEIIMPSNTMMMIHNMWMYTVGNATELRKAADDLEKINEAGRTAYLKRSGGKLDEAKLIEMMDGETWLTAAECIEYGLADRLEEEEADLGEAEELLAAANRTLKQRISYNRAISAQLRQLAEPEPTPEPKPEPEPTPEPKPEPEPMTGLFAKFNK